MTDLSGLLDLQAHDTTVDQLQHRRSTLLERTELATVAAELEALERTTTDAEARRQELARGEHRFEDEAQLIEAKATSEQARLYSGDVTAIKELQAIEYEIESLKRRQAELEDEAIALMELIEPVDAELAALAERRSEIETRRADAEDRLAAGEREIDAELEAVSGQRSRVASGLDPELVATYETARSDLGGVAVSRLVGTTCDGCHLNLSAVELDRVKRAPSGTLVFHDECGRILVR